MMRTIAWVVACGVMTSFAVVTRAPAAAAGDRPLSVCDEGSATSHCDDFGLVAMPPTTTMPSIVQRPPTTTTTTTAPRVVQPPPPPPPTTTSTTGPRIVQPPTPTTTTVATIVTPTGSSTPQAPQPPQPPPSITGDAIVIGELFANPSGTLDDLAYCVDCLAITSGVAHAVGVGACPGFQGEWDVYLEVTTNIPAKIGIELYAPGAVGTFYGIYGQDFVTLWGATFHCIDPCTTYRAGAVAEDADGNVRWGYGSFDTPCPAVAGPNRWVFS